MRNFLFNPDQEFFIRELSRKFDTQINAIRHELQNFEKIGFVKAKMVKRKKFYKLNPTFKFINELESIFRKCDENQEKIAQKISACGDILLIVFTGVFLSEQSAKQVDLFIVYQNCDKEKLAALIEKNAFGERPIRFSAMETAEFLYRFRSNDKFLRDIFSDGQVNIAINKFAGTEINLEKLM
jgi:hypothetical protein